MRSMLFAGILAAAASVATAAPNDLFISEVFEGTASNMKYVEIYNPTTTAVDFGATPVSLRRYANAGTTFASIDLTGTIAAKGFYVIGNNTADFATYLGTTTANLYNANVNHNGNDKFTLFDGTTEFDGFAGDQIGNSFSFAVDRVAYRLNGTANTGAWDSAALTADATPADSATSPSGVWRVFTVTASNGNIATIGSPGAKSTISGTDETTVADWSMF